MDVVFDLGGVVLTWRPSEIIASVYDSPAEQDLVLHEVLGHPDRIDLDRGVLDHPRAARRAAARTGLSAESFDALLAAVTRALVPVPEALALVDEVRAIRSRVFALSNLHSASLARLRSTFDVFDHFDDAVVSCEVGLCKPESAIYETALARFGLEPGGTVFVDDVTANLDEAAHLGITPLLFESVESCRSELRCMGCI